VKQAVKRFDKLISASSDLRTIKEEIERHGIWKDLIPGLAERDKTHSRARNKEQNRKNASKERLCRKKLQKFLIRCRRTRRRSASRFFRYL